MRRKLITVSALPAPFILVICAQIVGLSWPLTALDKPAPFQPPRKVEVVGTFSDIKHTTEHAYGYSLQLWREKNKIFGLLSVYNGPQADPPVGILEDVKFDDRTRQLSFSARLSTGIVYAQGYSGVPSRDRFSFGGVLTKNQVTGILKRSDELFPQHRPESMRIRLRRSEESSHLMLRSATYSDWKSWADEILQRRGPRW